MKHLFWKSTLLFTGFLLSNGEVSAQFPIKKGAVLAEVTGETTLSSTTTSTGNNTGKSVSNDVVLKLSGGYFLKENTVIGATVIPVHRKIELPGTGEGKGKGLTVGVFGRKYFTLSEKLAVTIQGNLEGGYANGATNAGTLDIDTRTSFLKLSGVLGAGYFLSPRIGLQADFDVASLQYLTIKAGTGGKPAGIVTVDAINKVPAISVRFSFLF